MNKKELKLRLLELVSLKGEGTFEAEGHWYISLFDDGSGSWNYVCCHDDECGSGDHEGFKNVDQLFSDDFAYGSVELDLDWEEQVYG